MQAIIVTGGKQYNVSEGDTLFIEKLDVNAGDAVVFDHLSAATKNTPVQATVHLMRAEEKGATV